jgi:hypothetical protein
LYTSKGHFESKGTSTPTASVISVNFIFCIFRLRVFENRVLRRTFGAKRDGVTGEWRKLHNEELDDLYSSPNIVRVIKSRRMRSVGHSAFVGGERCMQGFGGET